MNPHHPHCARCCSVLKRVCVLQEEGGWSRVLVGQADVVQILGYMGEWGTPR